MTTQGPTQDDKVADSPNPAQNTSAAEAERAALQADELEKIERRERLRTQAHEAREALRKKSFTNRIIIVSAATFVMIVLNFISFRNPEIYDIDASTLKTINQAVNALILMTIPFVLGSIGAFTRVLISDFTPEHKGGLIVSSGLMGVFSWVSIKSGVLLALVAPHIEKTTIPHEMVASGQSDFYTLALVAIAVGMFSTNVYLMIAQRVDQITRRTNLPKP